jgi:hypothetical protein
VGPSANSEARHVRDPAGATAITEAHRNMHKRVEVLGRGTEGRGGGSLYRPDISRSSVALVLWVRIAPLHLPLSPLGFSFSDWVCVHIAPPHFLPRCPSRSPTPQLISPSMHLAPRGFSKMQYRANDSCAISAILRKLTNIDVRTT